LTVLPPSVLSGVGLTEWEGQEMITETKTKGKPGLVRETLRRLHRRLLLLPTVTTKAVINERVRAKIAADILVMMKESGTPAENLAKVLHLTNAEMREWIWSRDLTISELVNLLYQMDSEPYFIIRPHKTKETS